MIDRKSHWQNVYHGKSPLDVSWYQRKPDLSLELIHRSGVRKDDAIIDVGGGASVLVDFLSSEGYTKLSVLDIAENALACAKERLGNLANGIEWFESDITEFIPPHQFLLWHDRAVFHFLTDKSDRKKYVGVLKNALHPTGQLIIAAFTLGGPTKCSGLDAVQYDAPKLIVELGEEFLFLEQRSEIHLTPGHKEQKFMYFRFARKTVDNVA